MNTPAFTDVPAGMFTVRQAGLATQRPGGACVWQSVYVPVTQLPVSRPDDRAAVGLELGVVRDER